MQPENPAELLAGSEFNDVECTSCGSRFNLAADASTVSNEASDKYVGHFRLVEALGTGSFGSVWKAHDTELDRTVALKFPRKTDLGEDERELFSVRSW